MTRTLHEQGIVQSVYSRAYLMGDIRACCAALYTLGRELHSSDVTIAGSARMVERIWDFRQTRGLGNAE